MESKICRINGIEIVAVEKEGTVYVPIRPICQVLGVDSKVQRTKIQTDEFFASTGVIITSVGADGKCREMFCLPLKDIYGWLATINPGKVAPEARETVIRYRRECYDVLYDHFERQTKRQKEWVEREKEVLAAKSAALDEISELKKSISEKQGVVRKADEDLALIQKERLDPTPSLFD